LMGLLAVDVGNAQTGAPPTVDPNGRAAAM
jgi:hypothetical protein